MANKKQPNPIDIHVGSRVRLRRMMLSMSQEKLGEHQNVGFRRNSIGQRGPRKGQISGKVTDLGIELGERDAKLVGHWGSRHACCKCRRPGGRIGDLAAPPCESKRAPLGLW